MAERRERPIRFSAPMVRAILAGAKSQTRRIVSKANSEIGSLRASDWLLLDFSRAWVDPGGTIFGPGPYLKAPMRDPGDDRVHRVYPRMQVGDRLWVKETFAPRYFDDGRPGYRANWTSVAANCVPEPKWKPSIFMRRHESRITLEITEVRAQRVTEIDEHDAIAEGVSGWALDERCETARDGFRLLWDAINKARGFSWDANPWVWAISFRRLP